MIEEISKEEFMNLSDKEASLIVKKIGRPKIVVLMPDATRRTGIIYKKMKPNSDNFEHVLFEYLSGPFTELSKTFYNQGLKTLFIPGFTHGNLQRGERYVNAIINTGVKSILTDDVWLEFYKDYKVNVNYYGDFNYVKKVLNKQNYKNFITWCNDLKEMTKNNKKRIFYWGFACSSTLEYERIARMSIDFYKQNNEYPTREDLIKLYYGRLLDNVDIYIRPGEIRDSDCQPPIIGGLSQFYFPIAPLTELSPDFYRNILYDFLFNRIITYSKKLYFNSELNFNELNQIYEYYKNNRDEIIGLGGRIGKFWISTTKINYKN